MAKRYGKPPYIINYSMAKRKGDTTVYIQLLYMAKRYG